MLNRLRKLEELVRTAAARIRALEDENSVLKQQLKAMDAERQRMLKNSAGAKELAQFKEKVRKKLLRINARIEKAVTLQDSLFGEEFDDAE